MSTLTFSSRHSLHRFPEIWELTLLGVAPLAIFIVSFWGADFGRPWAMGMWWLYAFVFLSSTLRLFARSQFELGEDGLVYTTRWRSHRIAYRDIRGVVQAPEVPTGQLVILTEEPPRCLGIFPGAVVLRLEQMSDASGFVLAFKERLERHALPGTYNRGALFRALKGARLREQSAALVSARALPLLTGFVTLLIPAIAWLTFAIGRGEVFVFLGITAVPLLAVSFAQCVVANRLERLGDIVRFELPERDRVWEKTIYLRAAVVAAVGTLASTGWLIYAMLR